MRKGIGGIFDIFHIHHNEIWSIVTLSPEIEPASAPLDMRNAGLRLREAAVNMCIRKTDLAKPEPIGLEIHPRCNSEPMSDHVACHNKQQDEHDED